VPKRYEIEPNEFNIPISVFETYAKIFTKMAPKMVPNTVSCGTNFIITIKQVFKN